MTAVVISTLPTPPNRNMPQSTFTTTTDAFLAALPLFQTEVNAAGVQISTDSATAFTKATEAAASAAAALASQNSAAASAAAAVAAPGTNATSTTSLSIGAGTKVPTVQTGKSYVPGMQMVIARTSDPANQRMWGTCVAYVTGTGVLTISVPAGAFVGGGTFTDWTVTNIGVPGATPDSDNTMPELSIGASASLVTGNNGYSVVATATSAVTTDTPANLGAGWCVFFPAQAYVVTITATFTDGASSKVIPIGGGGFLQTNGALDKLRFTPFGVITESAVIVTTGNGHGSTNTRIRRFTTVQSTVGTDITYADSAANGGTFTINASGMYAIAYADSTTSNTDSQYGVSKNSAQLTTSIASITAADRLMMTSANRAAMQLLGTVVVQLTAGDVIRAHTDAAPNSTTASTTYFSIRRIL